MKSIRVNKAPRTTAGQKLLRRIYRCREYYLFMIPGIITIILFAYVPMWGLQMAWKKVTLGRTIQTAPWCGWSNFERFFQSGWFGITVRNTLLITILNLVIQFPFPIILALLLHNCPYIRLKKFTQSATYIPHLLSVVIVVSILNIFFNGESGFVNVIIRKFGGKAIPFFGSEKYVAPLYIGSNLWQHAGYGAVIYLAALSAIDSEIIEAAIIDGCTKLKLIRYIDLPTIRPTIITLLILNVGQVFAMGAEKMLLLQTPMNLGSSEVIATYIYKTGVLEAQYGFGTAVGLLTTFVNFLVLITVNWLSGKLTETSLF